MARIAWHAAFVAANVEASLRDLIGPLLGTLRIGIVMMLAQRLQRRHDKHVRIIVVALAMVRDGRCRQPILLQTLFAQWLLLQLQRTASFPKS
jgi:hypothetical protein